jgi:hypothetical protein
MTDTAHSGKYTYSGYKTYRVQGGNLASKYRTLVTRSAMVQTH